MIVLTLAGSSSRFFKEGYRQVKYKLPLNDGRSIIETIIDELPKDQHVIFVINRKFNDCDFFKNLLVNKQIEYSIVEVNDTEGQLKTVELALSELSESLSLTDSLVVFNGDTLRFDKFGEVVTRLPLLGGNVKGLIEVVKEEGQHWSFVDKLGSVNRVTEKERISNLCSTGLYVFESISYFLNISASSTMVKDEHYIAPLYNHIINDGYVVKSYVIDRAKIEFLGTPNEYNKFLSEAGK